MKKLLLLLTLVLLSLTPSVCKALDLRGRMGIGLTNQLANDLPALSLKIQQNRTTALGAVLGLKSDEDDTLYGAGFRAYRLIFDEPQLNFYLAALAASLKYKDGAKSKNGYQFDATMGSEFHFQGLESIGFSFEFGISVNDVGNGTTIPTLGNNFLKAAIHFYL